MNILFITADQWRGDCLSAVGHSCVKTPNIDELISDGTLFANHYSVTAPCGPARASLYTGMYQKNHRVVRNGSPLDDRHGNIALELRKAGYQPTVFGYTDTALDPRSRDKAEVLKNGYEGILPGFDEGLLLLDSNPQQWLQHMRNHGYDFTTLADAYAQVNDYPGMDERGKTYPPPGYPDELSQTAFLTDRVIDYLDTAGSDWCVHLSYLRPHPPFVATEPWNAMYSADAVPAPVRAPTVQDCANLHPWLKAVLATHCEWNPQWLQQAVAQPEYDRELRQLSATYYGLVSKVDHYIGKLIAHLKKTSQYDDTLIIFTSDHGELLGDQWLLGKQGFFDSAYHIPLVIRHPLQPDSARGNIQSIMTESVDVMPSILDLLGRPIPRQCDGHSLSKSVMGEDAGDVRKAIHWEYDFRDIENPVLEKALAISMDECQMTVIKNERYKYVHFTSLPALFFDLRKDPQEINNLIEERAYAAEVIKMQQEMLSWQMKNNERSMTHMKVTREKILQRECD